MSDQVEIEFTDDYGTTFVGKDVVFIIGDPKPENDYDCVIGEMESIEVNVDRRGYCLPQRGL